LFDNYIKENTIVEDVDDQQEEREEIENDGDEYSSQAPESQI
jgi:hypothetical protein